MWNPSYILSYSPPVDTNALAGLVPNEGYVGPRKVGRKTIDKRRDRNFLARQARKKNRQKGLGKVKWHWSVNGGYNSQARNK